MTKPPIDLSGLSPNEQQRIDWINNASYEALLRRWRFAAVGDPMFKGRVGDYYTQVLAARRDADPDGHVLASKQIGWER